jgi:hypothetical protein
MSAKTNGSDAAFAAVNDKGDGSVGLTKREYFAAMAMQGLVLDPDLSWPETGRTAVIAADFLIEALNKEPK